MTHLSRLSDSVLNCKSKGHRPAQSGEAEHVLVVQRDPRSPAQVEQRAERVDVGCPRHQDRKESPENEPKMELVVAEGEHGNADVREDKILEQKVEQLKELASSEL